jgi:hypothetical protein
MRKVSFRRREELAREVKLNKRSGKGRDVERGEKRSK